MRTYTGKPSKMDLSVWTIEARIPDEGVEWVAYSRAQDKGPEWRTWKLVADGRALGKANYWFVHSAPIGKTGYGRDLGTLRQARPGLYDALMALLRAREAESLC